MAVNNGAFQDIPFTGTVSYGAANSNNEYPSVRGVSLTYNTNGNLTSDGFNTLTCDVENRLTQAQNGPHGTTQYFYDSLGHRKQKVTGGVTTQFVLAGDEEIADFTGTGVGTAQMLTVRGVGGLPAAEVSPGSPETVIYYHHDVLGSSVAATGAGQNGAEAFTYGSSERRARGTRSLTDLRDIGTTRRPGSTMCGHGIIHRRWGGFCRRIRLGWRAGRICMGMWGTIRSI